MVTSRGPATHDEARTWTLPCYSPAAGEESVCASCGASCRSASPRSTSQVEQGHNWSHDYEDEATEVKSVLSSVASEYASCPMTMVAGTEQLPSLPQRSGFQNPMEVCSSSLDVQSMAAGTPPTGGGEAAAEATFRGKAGTTMKGVEPSWFCLSGAMGLCVTWLGTFSLFQGGTRLMANGMQGLIMLLLRMQRRHLLRRWPDLMEKFTHVLSEGRLRSERHRVLTEDGHEIHFYRLRRVTRCCCRTDCACSSVGFSAGTPEAVEAAAAVAAAAAARKAGPAPSSSFHNGNSSNKRLDGKVFFFQHGLLESSLNWIAGGWLSLPFIVAARGGEVWLGNSRGNEYTRPLKQRPPMQQVQQSSVSSSSSQYTPESLSGQNEEFNERGLSLFTLHEYIAEQQHRLEALKQRTGHEADVQLLTQYLQVDPEEGECCSFFCCKCSGLTALPCITGKSPQEQLRLLQQTCMDASALLLRMHWAGQSACKGASESEQHQGTGGAGVTVTPKGAKAGGSPLCEPTADAVACLPRSMQFDMFELNRSLSASSTFNRMKSTATSPATSSTNRMPDSGIRCGGQSAAEAKFAAWPLCETDGMSAELFAYTAPSNYTDDGIREDGCSCSRWSSSRRGPSRRLRGCQGSRRNKRTDRPPFEFSNDSAKGPWSFHEMATYDCPAQLQYIAMKSPALRQQRAAALRATADFKSGSESGCGGQSSFACGLVAVGQSQGAAQLLAALSMSPSVGLLARRLVLFSPPLILQPLTELPRAALLLLQLGLQYPRVLLKALRFLVSLIPGRVLASVGNAVVGKGRPGSMNFYSTPLESQQLALNFSYTPSGRMQSRLYLHQAVPSIVVVALVCVNTYRMRCWGNRDRSACGATEAQKAFIQRGYDVCFMCA